MKDLQILKLVDQIPVRRVGMSPDTPGNIRLEGSGFLSAVEVRLNGLPTASLSVLSAQILEVTIPAKLAGVVIETIEVLSDTFTGSESSRLEYELGPLPKAVSGLLKAIQQFISILLTTSGSDIFHKSYGGNLFEVLKTPVDVNKPGTFTGPLLAAVERTTKQIITSQVTQRISLDEKLKRVDVIGISFDKQATSINVRLGFEVMSGIHASASLGLS